MEEKEETTQHPLEDLIEKPTKIITTEGRVFVGILRGLDQALNCILSDAEEREFS
jgi:small nuclear ribonucleoprotein (snRNP)-like protein